MSLDEDHDVVCKLGDFDGTCQLVTDKVKPASFRDIALYVQNIGKTLFIISIFIYLLFSL